MVSIFLHVLRESSELLVTVLSKGKLRPSPKAWQGSDLGACSLTDLIPETLIVILARVSAQASQFSTSPVRYVCVSCPYGAYAKRLLGRQSPVKRVSIFDSETGPNFILVSIYWGLKSRVRSVIGSTVTSRTGMPPC